MLRQRAGFVCGSADEPARLGRYHVSCGPPNGAARASGGEPNLSVHRLGGSRAAAAIGIAVVVVALSASAALHASLVGVFDAAGALLATHPRAGPAVFVLLAAASAMVAFFSSAVLVPAGVVTWGMPETAALLSLGWLFGGVATYGVARWLGRPLLSRFVRVEKLEMYERRIARETPFGVVFLFQLALPSEVPGYVLGLAGYPMLRYLTALALVEVPFAAATVWLGQEFLRREVVPVLLVLAIGVLAGGLALRRVRRHLDETPPREPPRR
ncbi:MAG TPA: VTT domain-containing protein [Gemmatimonadaceae bacterium]|nr:VTT domain-containing protein [Gemmatimonadaceae bacterium]